MWKAGCAASATVSIIVNSAAFVLMPQARGARARVPFHSAATSTGLCGSSPLRRAELRKAVQAAGPAPGAGPRARFKASPAGANSPGDTASRGHQRAKRPQRAQEQAWSPASLNCHILKTENPSPKRVPETGGQAGKPERGTEGAASRSTQGRPQRTLWQPSSPGTQGSPSAAQVVVPSEPVLLIMGGVTRLAGCI